MRFIEQSIPGFFLIESQPFSDDRGVFRRNFCAREFEAHGITSRISQANISENFHRHTLRGFHYQLAPFGEGKTMTVLQGAIYDIVVDLREDSPCYRKWQSFTMHSSERRSFHVPPGCANAFLSLEDNTLLHYYVSEFYSAQAESGIRYNDPCFQFEWPAAPAVISEKDSSWPDYKPSK